MEQTVKIILLKDKTWDTVDVLRRSYNSHITVDVGVVKNEPDLLEVSIKGVLAADQWVNIGRIIQLKG